MTDFPTVGLGVDLSGIDKGRKAYQGLKGDIAAVGDVAEKTTGKVQASANKQKAANTQVAQSAVQTGKVAEKAIADKSKAEAAAAKKAERDQKYLQRVRIASIKMEEAARRAADSEIARASAKRIQDADRAVKRVEQQEKYLQKVRVESHRMETQAAKKAAADQEAIERGILAFRIRMRGQEFQQGRKADAEILAFRQRMSAQQKREAEIGAAAEKKAAADVLAFQQRMWAQRSRELAAANAANAKASAALTAKLAEDEKYLQRVRLESFRMQERAAKKLADEEARAARAAAGGGRGGIRTPRAPAGGGGGGGGPILPTDVTLVDRFGGALGGLRRGLSETRRLFFDLRTAVGVFLAGMLVQPVLQMADAMTALRARVGAFADRQSDVPYLMEAVYKAAQRSRSPLEAIATLYTRLAPLAQQLGKSQLELLRISETVAKGFQIGGATPEEAKSSAQQLAQALAANRLGGDELRSLAENAPILMQKIAQALNMNTGQFIKWAHEGKANAQVVIGALEIAASEIDRLFAKFPVTIGQATTLVRNALTNMVGKVNELTGASAAIAGVIAQFAGFLESSKTINAVAAAVNVLAKAFQFLGQAMGVVVAAWPALAAVLAALAVGKIMAMVQAWKYLQLVFLANAAAMGVTTKAFSGMAAAQLLATRAMVGMKAAGGALLAMFGGPFGLALIAVAAGFSYVQANTVTATQAMDLYAKSTEGAAGAVDRAISFLQVYGADTKQFTDYLLELNGVQEDQVRGLDEAGRAAVARAENERALTAALLDRAAAESIAAAATLRRSVAVDLPQRLVRRAAVAVLSKDPNSRAYNPEELARRQTALAESENSARFRDELASRLEQQGLRLPQMADAVRNAKLNVTTPGGGGTAQNPAAKADAKGGRSPRDQTDERSAEIARQIAEAQKDQLQAQLALTKGAMDRAAIEKRISAAEYDEKIAEIDGRIAKIKDDKKNTEAASQIAALQGLKATEEITQSLKNQAIDQAAADQVQDQNLRRQQDLANFTSQALQAEVGLARTVEERNRLEAEALKTRQASERQALANDLARQVRDKEMTIAEAREVYAAQQRAASADKETEAREAAARLQERNNALANADVANRIDVLDSQMALARTESERADIAEKILLHQQYLERLALDQIINGVNTSETDRKIAEAKKRQLGEIQGNQRKEARNTRVAANLNDAGSALQDIAANIKGNLGKTVDKVGAAFQNVAQAFATGGPIFAAMAAITEVGKAIGGKTGAAIAGFGSGGLVGAALSVIGYNKEKKKAREEAERKAQEERAAKALEIVNQTRQLEIDLLRATGKESAAVAAEREIELEGLRKLSPALADLKSKVYAAADAAADKELLKALEALGLVSESSIEARKRLVELAGGIDELTAQVNRYQQAFLNDGQRIQPVIKEVFTELGRLGYGSIRTKDQFAELVSSLDLTTEKGASTFASLMKIAPGFAQVVEYLDTVSTATAQVVDARQDFQESYDAEVDRLNEIIDARSRAADNLRTVYNRERERLQGIIDKATESASVVLDIYERTRDSLQATKDELLGFVDALKAFKDELDRGPLALNSPEDQYLKTKGEFERVRGLAAGGDTAAIGRLQEVSTAFLEASREYFASGPGYFADLDAVKGAVDNGVGVAQEQADKIQLQLDALTGLLTASGLLKETVDQTLEDALANWAADRAEAATAQVTLDDMNNRIKVLDSLDTLLGLTFDQAYEQFVQANLDAAEAEVALETLNESVKGLLKIDASVLSVEQAIINLNAAMAEQALAYQTALNAITSAITAGQMMATNPTVPSNDNSNVVSGPWNAQGYLNNNPDILAEYNRLIATADPNSPWFARHGLDQGAAGFAEWHFQNTGVNEGRRWARGGAFHNGLVMEPTFFDRDVMGEAGAEAVVPLVRTSDGSLGVKTAGGSNDNGALLAAIQGVGQAVRAGVVVAQAGHMETIKKLGEVVDETADLRTVVRQANA